MLFARFILRHPILLFVFALLTSLILISSPLYSFQLDNTQTVSAKAPNRVPHVDSEATIDGILDEPMWELALVMSLDYEVRPAENVPPPVKTDVLFAYSDKTLFIAFRAYDPDPSKIRARISDRDNMWSDDWVAINLDTFNDERNSFLLVCNPFGIQADNIETNGNGTAWDAIWDSNGLITSEGYQVEMAVPFSSLRFQRTEGDQVWGVDAIRSYPRNVRHHIGLFPRDRNNNCYLCQAEKLIGFAGATPGKNIEIDPTISGIFSQERENETSGKFIDDAEQEAGVTGRWGITPNMTLSATVNPDFSQVEADAAQLDVNKQYTLYYSERRPFFLEGSSFFDSRMNIVHTRTLADPDWGVKLTGKEGKNSIGLFSARDEVTNLIFPSNEGSDDLSLNETSVGSALRFNHDLGKSSTVGFLTTSREGDNYSNRLGGVDAVIKFQKEDQVTIQFLTTTTAYPDTVFKAENISQQPYGSFNGNAFDFNYFHGTRSLDWYVEYREIDENFRADIGFIPRSNFRRGEAGLGYTWNNSNDAWWNMLNWGGGYVLESENDDRGIFAYNTDSRSNYRDDLLLAKHLGSWFDYNGLMQSYFNMYGEVGTRTFNEEWYRNNFIWFGSGFRPTSDLWVHLEGVFGDEIDYDNERRGTLVEISPQMENKFGKHLSISLRHTFQTLHVPGGELFAANISRLRTVYQFNQRTFVRLILQNVDYRFDTSLYEDDEQDEESQNVFSQLLFSYKINPQTVFYLGYSDNSDGDQELKLTQTNRTLFAKIGYAWVL